MRYYLVAGEASGDLHGSNLMKQLQVADSDATFRFFGGDLMQTVGGTLVKHYREMAFMGLVNVLRNLKTISKNMAICKSDILAFKPDVVILIDYPGFNLRIAEFAKQNNIKTFYYISPKIWAWKTYRVKKIKKCVDEMFTIFPFETEFYSKYNYRVHYVGNPLKDALDEFKKNMQTKSGFLEKNKLNQKPIVALLAGSRVQEIKSTLPLMMKTAALFPDFQFVIAGIKSVGDELYKTYIEGSGLALIYDQTYDLLNNAHAAIVTSGTAALETALFKVPQTVIYKVEGGWFIDVIMRNFVIKTVGVALPNIIMNEEFVVELIQKKMTLKNVKDEMKKLLYDEEYRKRIIDSYVRLDKMIGEAGCSERAAQKMVTLLKEKV